MNEQGTADNAITVLIADDHPIIRFGLTEMINSFGPPFQLIAEASDGQAAWDAIFQHRPNIAVLDITMPIMDGLVVASKIDKHQLSTQTIILSSYLNTENIYKCFRTNVLGILHKETALPELKACLEKVALGKKYLSDHCKDMIKAGELTTNEEDKQEALEMIGKLTDKEKEVLRLIGQISASKEIAKQTNNSVRTIDNHRFRIAKKLRLDGHGTLAIFSAKFNHLL